MKLLVSIFVAMIAVGAFVGVGLALQRNASADTVSYTCGQDGFFTSPTTGPAMLNANDSSRAANAATWLEGMTHTRTTTVTNSTIAADASYDPSYQGAMTGTFSLEGRSFATNASISVTSPSVVSDDYRGVVSGRVLETPSSFRWIIQAYKRVDGVISQVALQALADGSTGNFSIDLSSVDPGVAGEWMFGLLDADNGYAPYGEKWPDSSYVGLEVQQYIITDTLYYWSTTAAKTDGTFAFANSNTGSKLFRLVDTTTDPDDILAEYTHPTGLIRSYQYQSGEEGYGTALEDRSFVYDQAVALFAAISLGDDALAKTLVTGLLRLQTTTGDHTGGFVFAGPQLSPTYTDNLYRTGAHAIATGALLAYVERYPTDGDDASYIAAAKSALDFMETTRSTTSATSGLYLGGYGLYSGTPQTFDEGYAISWASTEHNIDAWHALTRAARVLGNSEVNYAARATALNESIVSKLYNTTQKRFNQGVDETGQDTADPLDTNSWGAIQLYASGNVAAAQLAVNRLSLFEYTSSGIDGYGPFYDAGGYPGATPTVWYEGSFGVTLAYYKLGDYERYRTTLDALAQGQEADGSFRYATAADSIYEIGTSKSVASTAWYILATTGRDTIWNACMYNPPAATSTPDVPSPSTTGEANPVINVGRATASGGTAQTSAPAGDEMGDSPAPISTDEESTTNKTEPYASDDKASRSTTAPLLIAGGVIIVLVAGATALIVRRRG